MKKTPLYAQHVALGGKLVPYAGYDLPVQFPAGILAEHAAVRNRVGLFDVSHMGEVLFTGECALASLNRLLTNDFSDLPPGGVRYSPMCNHEGGVLDDVLVYCLGDERYMVVVNAANRMADVAWMTDNALPDTLVQDVSCDYAQIALQGPAALALMQEFIPQSLLPQKRFRFTNAKLEGCWVMVSRTGYTGEDGFELYCAPDDALTVWKALLEAGETHDIAPCGLGSRDLLRLEAAMPLYGHELDAAHSPLQAGLGAFVKMNKPDFIGKKSLQENKFSPITRVGLRLLERGIAREGCPVLHDGKPVGIVTSGTHSPSCNAAIAMAYVDAACATQPSLTVDVRGRMLPAEMVALPFYTNKPRGE